MLPYLLLLGLSGTQAPAAPPVATDALGQAYYLLLQAHAAEERNDLTTAVVNFRQALTLLPGSADIHVELAGIYVQQAQIDDGEREARAALAADGESRAAHRILGWIQAATLERAPAASRDALAAEAIGHLERAIEAGVSDPPAQIALASLYVRARNGAKAEALLNEILADQPGLPAALRLQALAYQLQGRQADADRVVDSLLGATPDNVELQVRQIERVERSGAWADAVQGWATVIGRTDGGALYRARYAVALANSGEIEKARVALGEVARDAPMNVSPWYLLAQIEARAKNFAAAEAAARRAAEVDAADLRGPLALAAAHAARNDYRGVVRALEGRIEKARDADLSSGFFEEIARELNEAHVHLGHAKDGIAALNKAAARVPGDASLRFLLAAAYEQDHQFAPAEKIFREILVQEPSQPQVLNYLGYMLADRGEKLPEAVEFINRALALDPGNPSYLDSLGWAYFKMGRFENARDPLERAATLMPKASVIQDHLGDLYVSLKKYAEAADAFGRALVGDKDGVDVAAVTKKRDQARALAARP